MTMNRKCVLFSMFLVVLLLMACGEEGDESNQGEAQPDVEEDELFIPIISKGFQHQFWQAVRQGAEQAAEEYGAVITFEGPESESNVDRQIDMLRAALDNQPDAIGFAALDSQASIPILQQAEDSGIPVVAFDSGVDSEIPITTASTDNKAASALAAERMAELIDGEGQIGLIVHDQTSITGVDRRDGFVEYMEEHFPAIEIVDIQYGGGDHLNSTDLAKTILLAYPDLRGFFGSNEGSAIGIINAVNELNKAGEVVVVGFDSGDLQMEAIRSGVMAGAVTQNPVGIGYETVKAAVQAVKGEEVEELIDTGFFWYDQSNIDDEDIQAALYE
ncbi:ABC transporter substrate-binding protein [Halalkalibacter sp. APA_J-10(15)]|uniref:ABC transporter substrate-binding protein n=1 Tax=Halalkalibacter sp. APA_J-10(15) TaxID=2933805 RepID=UPI001FF31976|nr:ABC transporter substrate-binding protein [Halalkalibacter sp. APA_J-10(15)]MCK0470492.1 ABC transporter substrate-binding protein [Halalkalibacter sp. APA_J-10(15)]